MSLTQYQVHTEPVSTRPETVTEDRWHQPWSIPVRPKIAPALAIALIASGAVISPWALTQPETTSVDRYLQPLSQPYPAKRGLPTGDQQALAYTPLVTETITVDKWFKSFTEPVRAKLSLIPAAQQPYAVDTDPVVSFGWIGNLSEPQRVKPGLAAAAQQTFTTSPFPLPNPTVALDWYLAFTDPPKRPAMLTAAQQFFATDPTTPVAATVAFGWFTPLSEPLRTKASLLAAAQQPVTADTDPVVSFSWFGGLGALAVGTTPLKVVTYGPMPGGSPTTTRATATTSVFTQSAISSTASGTSIAATVPGTAVVGDMLIGMLLHRSAITAAPSGWAIVDTCNDLNGGITQFASIYQKTATSGDIGASASWSQTSADRMFVQIAVCRRSDGVNPSIISHNAQADGANTSNPLSIPIPAATATATNGQVGVATGNFTFDISSSSSSSGQTGGWTLIGGQTGGRMINGYIVLTNGQLTGGTFTSNTNSVAGNGVAAVVVIVG